MIAPGSRADAFDGGDDRLRAGPHCLHEIAVLLVKAVSPLVSILTSGR